jgi:hypothetical protein
MTEHAPNGRDLNVVTLRDYIERVVADQEKAVNAALKAHDLRHEANDASVAGRLEKLNELRSEVIQDRGEYVRKDVFETQLKPLIEFRSRALGAGAVLALVAGAVGAAILKVLGG